MNSLYSIHHICSFMVENQLSGHSYSVPALCESLSKNIDIQFHTTGKSHLTFNPSFKIHEYKVDPFLGSILSSKDFKTGLKKTVKNGNIIHNHGLWRMPNLYPLAIKKEKNIKIIVSPRGSLSQAALNISKYKKNIFNTFFRQNDLLKECDSFHATSLKEKDEIRELGFKQPIAIIPNGIDIPSCTKKTFSKNKIKFLFLGRIHPIKGLELLINAWKEIDDKKAILDVCGYCEDENYYKSLKNLVKKLGISNIIFSDKVFGESKKNKFLENDIFILPSKTENFGLVVAEALSYGLPVITSENTPWKIIEEKKCGWIVSLNKENIISTIDIAKNLSSESLKRIGNNGRLFVQDKYSWKKLNAKYVEYYNWVNAGGKTPEFVDLF